MYDYINIAREGLKKKIELLNTDNYNKLKSNRLEIVFLEFSRVEQDKVEDLMDEIIEIQKKYETKFDVVYLRLLEDIIVFDLNGGTVDRYCIQKLKNKPNGERIRECLSDGMCYSLSDVVDFRGKR